MQTNIKVPEQAVWINNSEAIITLKINKVQLENILRKFVVVLIFVALATCLIITYQNNIFLFWPLLNITAILCLIALEALLSGNAFYNEKKKKRRNNGT